MKFNYNVILLSNDLQFKQQFATSIMESTRMNNNISIYDIRRKNNSSKISTEFNSQALFYESIENSLLLNNVIIPDDIFSFNLEYILDYQYVLPKTKFFIVAVKERYSEYEKSFKKNLAYKRKYRIPKSLYSQGPTDKATFNSRMSGLIYEEKRLPKLVISMKDDLYTNIIKFTEFAVKHNIDIIEKEN